MCEAAEAAEAAPTSAQPKDAKSVLESLAVTLADRPGGDLELTQILVQHILTETPVKKAPEQATAAIVALAQARATALLDEEASHG